MMLSRGCPFKCTFCDAPIVMGTKLRFFSLDRIISDIKFYKKKYGVTNFVFKDSTFTAKKKWAHEFCQRLIDENLDIKWRCNTRVNLVPPGLLDLMAEGEPSRDGEPKRLPADDLGRLISDSKGRRREGGK